MIGAIRFFYKRTTELPQLESVGEDAANSSSGNEGREIHTT